MKRQGSERRQLLGDDEVGAQRFTRDGSARGTGRGADAGSGRDRIAAVRQQLSDVRGIMVDNIGRVLKRGEDLDRLQARTADLVDTSEAFEVVTRRVKRRMFWRRVKHWAIVGGIAVVVVVVVVLAVAL